MVTAHVTTDRRHTHTKHTLYTHTLYTDTYTHYTHTHTHVHTHTHLQHPRYEIAQKLSELDLTSMDETAKPSDIANTATLDQALYCIADFAARSVEVEHLCFQQILSLGLFYAVFW